MTQVVIASAARTAVGSFSGSFANTPAHDLGTTVLEALVERTGVEKADVSQTILGQVLSAGLLINFPSLILNLYLLYSLPFGGRYI